jgi:hypothetical protein
MQIDCPVLQSGTTIESLHAFEGSRVSDKAKRRRSHVVPKFHLRHFADGRNRLIGRPRHELDRRVPMSVENATVRSGFYDTPDEYGEADQIENALSRIEDLAAPIVANVIDAGRRPSSDQDRYRLSVFMGMQLVRGVDTTAWTYAAVDVHEGLRQEAATDAVRSRIATLLGVDVEDVPEGVETRGFARPNTLPPEWWLRTAMLLVGAEVIGGALFVRQWHVLTLPIPSLVTSDRPLVLYRAGNADGEPTGFANADVVVFPLSRTCVLLMASEQFDVARHWQSIDEAVLHINGAVVASAYEWAFHHPDDELPNIDFPELQPDAEAEPFDVVTDGHLVRLRSRVMMNLPTPPRGWTPA